MKIKKRGLIALLAAAALTLAGCGGAPANETVQNDDGAKGVILAVSFGTSYNDSRDKTIGAIENALTEAYPDYEVRRAFTSQIIIDKLKERDGLEIDNVTEALDRLVADGVKELIVQPTHVMHGYEYDDTVEEIEKYRDKFDSVTVAEPLLDTNEDYADVAAAVADDTAEYVTDENTAVVLMGHGTEHDSNTSYAKLQDVYTSNGPKNYYIGTVEATPTLDEVMQTVKDNGYTKVILRPLMVVAGDHANNDMAGDEEDSWKSVFEKEGFEVECVLKGMGEIPAIQQIYVRHVKDAMDKTGE